MTTEGDYEVQQGDGFAFYGILMNTNLDEVGSCVECTIPGTRIHSVHGSFPALVRAWEPGPAVRGVLWRPHKKVPMPLVRLLVSEVLDHMEGFDPKKPERSMYIRERLRVITEVGEEWAWTYVWNGSTSNLALIPSGNWADERQLNRLLLF